MVKDGLEAVIEVATNFGASLVVKETAVDDLRLLAVKAGTFFLCCESEDVERDRAFAAQRIKRHSR